MSEPPLRRLAHGVSGLIRAVRLAASARAGVVLLLSVFLGLLLSPGASRTVPRYGIGEFTPRSIRAPYDFTIQDDLATRRRQEEAARLVPPVAAWDTALPERLEARLREAFSGIGALHAEADRLRTPADAETRRLSARQRSALVAERAREADSLLQEKLPAAVAAFEETLGLQLTVEQRAEIADARLLSLLQDTAVALIRDAYRDPIAADTGLLERAAIGDAEAKNGPGRLAIRNSRTAAERIVGLPLPVRDLARVTASLASRAEVLGVGLDPEARTLVAQVAGALIQANLVLDPATTSARRAAAAESVLPVSLSFSRNQLIIGEGQEVTEQTLLALNYLGDRGMPRAYLGRLVGTICLLFLFVTVAFRAADHAGDGSTEAPHPFPYLASSLALFAGLFWIWRAIADGLASWQVPIPEMALVLMFPYATIGMLTRLLFDSRVTLVAALASSVVLGLFSEVGVPLVGYAMIAGVAGAHWVFGCTRRSGILRAGLRVGAVSAVASVGLVLLENGWHSGSAVIVALGALLGGLLSGPAVVALSPVVEWAFGYTTGITLLEMVSYEHPLLKRIMREAPGTFQHSLSISILADAAARAIGANARLVRVGALYHDAGKIEQPEVFVENQTGPSVHDRLTPRESARAIRAHVADGVKLVREHQLGERIADFVREHHGTTAIKYFLEAARAAGGPVAEADFRYDGPSPRSRETGILMIADRVEATSRTMPGADEAAFRAMVRRTVDRLGAERQFDECPLTMRDLSAAGEAMVQVLVGMHHRRVEYPGQARPRVVAAG